MPKDAVFEAKIQVEAGKPIELPSGEFVANAAFVREGLDLHLTSPDGQEIVVEGYFAQSPAPDIVTADGAFLSPEMVDAFLPPEHVGQYAAANGGTAVDVSPAGQITELVGSATIIRADGTKVAVEVGTPVYPGDVIETSADGAVNILFADNTTFAISESARLSVDEFVYNAGEQEGSSFFSMLQGVFVYTSGLIGKNDPGNVNIETPVGSIGIRGTVVAGDINPAGQESTITIIDGAIVLTNKGGTLELNDSFETASLSSYSQEPTNMGQIDASTFSSSYQSVSTVASATFDSVSNGAYASSNTATTSSEAAAQDTADQTTATDAAAGTTDTVPVEAAPEISTEAVQPVQEGTGIVQPTQDGTTTEPPADGTQMMAPADGTLMPPPPTGSEPVFFMPPPPPPPSGDTTFTADGTTSFGGTGDSNTMMAPPPPPPPPSGFDADTTTNILPPPPPLGSTTGAPVYNGPNLAPGGSNLNISATEDVLLHFKPQHFGFVDANGNKLAAVIIDSLPATGVLQYMGTPVVPGQLPLTVPVTSLFDLTYAPPSNGFGTNFANFTFRVMDDGGTANGGVDTDPTANVLTLNILPVNDAPSGANNILGMNEDGTRTFLPIHFGFTDAIDGHGFAGIIISSLPANGDLRFGGTPVVVGQQIGVLQLGSLTFSPALNASGGAYASFGFKVVDTGGTLNGGINIDQTPNIITFNVSAVNDPPVLTTNAGPGTPMIAYSSVATIITASMLSGADVDTPAAGLTYTVTAAPMHGTLEWFNGTIWTGTTTFTQADIVAGKVKYVNDGSPNPADAFQFQLSDGTTTLAAQTFNISIPQLNFEFSSAYTKNTVPVGDDNVPLFGATPGWGPGTVIGQANLTDVTADHFELTYEKGSGGSVILTTSGDVLGDSYTFTTLGAPASISNSVPLFHFDAATGMVTLVNPLAANGAINGDFTFTITAKDGGGDVIGGQSFVINMVNFAGTVFLGAAGDDGLVNSTPTGTGGLTLSSNQAAFMDDGNDRVDALGGTNNVIMMGNGNDLVLVSNASFGMVDGGGGIDRLVLTGTSLTYDFDAMPAKAQNIEVLEVGGTNNNVYLTLQSIFEMTDANHTLTIKTNSAGQQANLHLDMDAFSVQSGLANLNPLVVPGSGIGSGTVNESGSVTLQATYNSSTITLIIEQGGTSDGIIVHNI